MFSQKAWFSVLVIGVLAVVGCFSGRPSRVSPPGIDASAAGSAAMKQYDTDGDGAVSGDELEKAPSLNAARVQIDRNEDGKITATEVADRIREWQDTKLGCMTVCCIVHKNKQPVAGATVTFVPEKFLGDNLKTATGVTDASGTAPISIPDADPSGVAPGLYLIRITKEGEDIPAKYNTETTIGQEVALDADKLSTGWPTYDID